MIDLEDKWFWFISNVILVMPLTPHSNYILTAQYSLEYEPIKPCRAELGLARQDEVGWRELAQVSFQCECILSWPNCAVLLTMHCKHY